MTQSHLHSSSSSRCGTSLWWIERAEQIVSGRAICSARSIHHRLGQNQDEDLKWFKGVVSGEITPNTSDLRFLSERQRELLQARHDYRILNGNIYLTKPSDDGSNKLLYLVPKNMTKFIINQLHTSIFSGHFGSNRTESRILERFFWKCLRDDVRQFTKTCKSCQLNKNTEPSRIAPLKPILPTGPRQLYTMDITGPLPTTKLRNKYILVICDHFTKWVKFYALKDITASTVAKFLVVICVLPLHLCSEVCLCAVIIVCSIICWLLAYFWQFLGVLFLVRDVEWSILVRLCTVLVIGQWLWLELLTFDPPVQCWFELFPLSWLSLQYLLLI